jgi:MarR family transcriptional regulator, organic hydroperoxide resistance regulator
MTTETKRIKNDAGQDYKKLRILIRQLSTLITKARDRELAGFGFTSVQSAVLFHLVHEDKNITIGMLADLMLIESHTASGLVKRMEEQGLIKILKPKGHRNRRYLTITKKGQLSYEKSEEASAIDELISHIPSLQRKETIKCLQTLREMIIKHLSIENKIYYP